MNFGSSIVYILRGHRLCFANVILSLKIIFVVASSVDTDEMLHDAAFHLGLHCLREAHLGVTNIQRLTYNFLYILLLSCQYNL